MLPLVVPTAAAGIHLVAAAACMCPAVAGTVVGAEVVVPPDMHCSPSVGTDTTVVVDVVAIAADSVSGAAIVAVSVAAVVAGEVAIGVATLTALSSAEPSMPLVCPAQTCPSPSVLSLPNQVLRLFHQSTSCTARACMQLCKCGPHHV